MNRIKTEIKSLVNFLGFDLVRTKNSPGLTLCGLRFLPIKTVIDVGANRGQFAKNISKFFPNAEIYCFEPLPGPLQSLNKWAESKKGKVKVFNLALGDKDSVEEIYLHVDHSPSSSFLKSTSTCTELFPFTANQQKASVKVATLDKVFSEEVSKIQWELLVKIDVQGYEDRVIRGGMKLISQAAACIVEVSLDKIYEGQAMFKDMVFMFSDLGFRYSGTLHQYYGNDGHVCYIDAIFQNTEVRALARERKASAQ